MVATPSATSPEPATTLKDPARNRERTIREAITEVLRGSTDPLSAADIYERIVARDLYPFRARDPVHVVQLQVRRHCKGLTFASAESLKVFGIASDGKYFLLPKPFRETVSSSKHRSGSRLKRQRITYEQVRELHAAYVQQFKTDILEQLKKLSPTEFERFSVRLLHAYGFTDLNVTRPSKDGGIDGFGALRVGLAQLRAAVQCKRWARGTVGVKEVRELRGAALGRAGQCVFFTTAAFSAEAQQESRESFSSGAVPVVLFDGPQIVDLMIRKRIGVTIDPLEIPLPELDLALQPEDP